jgi:hypothetical protein
MKAQEGDVPIYFNDVPPFCPVSRDQPVGPGRAPVIRTVIPRAHDLASAIAAVNIASSIINQIVRNTVINNVFSKPAPPDRTVNKLRRSRWKEDTSKRVMRKYKYYGVDEKGQEDKDTWVIMERIERMVWVDSGWKTSMTFMYGDKGEGEPV